MNIELDDMPLVKHVRDSETGATKDLRSVSNINIGEKRRIVEHKIPGLEGGILQDLGRQPLRICFDGVFFGESAKGNLQNLRSKFKMGTPVPFTSDISGAAEVNQVLIEDLSIEDVAGITSRYKYSIVLREYQAVHESLEETSRSQEKEAEKAKEQEQAEKEIEERSDDALGSKNRIKGKVMDEKGNPLSDVEVKISFDKGEYILKTDKEGVFQKECLDPGKYVVTIEDAGFENTELEVIIKSKTDKAEVKDIAFEEEEEYEPLQ